MQSFARRPTACVSKIHAHVARRSFAIPCRPFPDSACGQRKEPPAPVLLTTEQAAAATKNSEYLSGLEKHSDHSLTAQFPTNLEKSYGNFVSDLDGRMLLDVFMSISSIPLGYNHPRLLAASKSDAMAQVLANRTALGVYPPAELSEWLDADKGGLLSVAPSGMTRVTTQMCGSCSVEGAFKSAMINFAARKRQKAGLFPEGEDVSHSPEYFSEREMESCLCNQSPGSGNDLAILGFNSAFHGRLFGSLSVTRTKPLFKMDIAAFDWPSAEPPRYKYPEEENEAYNRAEDDRSLKGVAELVDLWKTEKGMDVCAVIMEPILAEGGDVQISSYFANKLREYTKEKGIYMIVDEVQAGVATSGTFWASEQWGLKTPPDYLTFAKKMLCAGFFHTEDVRMRTPYRHFNTFMGDPVRMILAKEVLAAVREDGLVQQAAEVGKALQEELKREAAHGTISSVRGRGTLVAFDLPTPEFRDAFIRNMRFIGGVNQGACGARTVRMRPGLYFGKHHMELYLEAMRKSLKATLA